MTPLPPPAELRESATALDYAYNDFGQGYGFEETANHLRQFADLIEEEENGVGALRQAIKAVCTREQQREIMAIAIEIAPHLALMTKDSP